MRGEVCGETADQVTRSYKHVYLGGERRVEDGERRGRAV